MFAIISEELIKNLTDRQLKVYSAIICLAHRGNGTVRLSEIKKLSNKGYTQLLEILKELENKKLLIRKKQGNYQVVFEFKLKFNVDLEGFNLRERKKVEKIINDFGLTEEQVKQIIEYIKKQRHIKDKARYFGWLARNYKKVFEQQVEQPRNEVEVENKEDFWRFQSYLSKRMVKFEVEKKNGIWIFKALNILEHYKNYKNELAKNRNKIL